MNIILGIFTGLIESHGLVIWVFGAMALVCVIDSIIKSRYQNAILLGAAFALVISVLIALFGPLIGILIVIALMIGYSIFLKK